MATVALFRDIDMAAMMSHENTLLLFYGASLTVHTVFMGCGGWNCHSIDHFQKVESIMLKQKFFATQDDKTHGRRRCYFSPPPLWRSTGSRFTVTLCQDYKSYFMLRRLTKTHTITSGAGLKGLQSSFAKQICQQRSVWSHFTIYPN